MPYEAIVLGVSAGGLQALKTLLPALPASFPLPIAIVQHIGARSDNFLSEYLDRSSSIIVKEAEDKEPLIAGTAYLAPPGYHLLIEADRSFSLSVDPRVNHCCPSIDVLFESAAEVYAGGLIGIILTGANGDGAQGLKAVKARGGLTIVQNPASAEAGAMPRAALAATPVDHVIELEQLAPLLWRLAMSQEEQAYA
jgi:two-component system, chemotaxis family, protein-glutamate methylesterase/glutaminase